MPHHPYAPRSAHAAPSAAASARRPRPSTRPEPSVISLGGGPLRRLSWIFGLLRDRRER